MGLQVDLLIADDDIDSACDEQFHPCVLHLGLERAALPIVSAGTMSSCLGTSIMFLPIILSSRRAQLPSSRHVSN